MPHYCARFTLPNPDAGNARASLHSVAHDALSRQAVAVEDIVLDDGGNGALEVAVNYSAAVDGSAVQTLLDLGAALDETSAVGGVSLETGSDEAGWQAVDLESLLGHNPMDEAKRPAGEGE